MLLESDGDLPSLLNKTAVSITTIRTPPARFLDTLNLQNDFTGSGIEVT